MGTPGGPGPGLVVRRAQGLTSVFSEVTVALI